MKFAAALGLAGALIFQPAPVLAETRDKSLDLLRARDHQLFATGWRLARANAPFCTKAAPSLGIAILDAGGFGDPAAVRAQLGLAGDIAVGAVAADSPAARAGITSGDTILAIGGSSVTSRFPPARPSYQRLIDVVAALDAAAASGVVKLTLSSDGAPAREIEVEGVATCPTRFEVLDGGGRAMAEGTRVILGRDFVGFSYPDEMFAAVVAHEFAHNLLSHKALLAEHGRSLGNVRRTEREADRLMPWLLANAGYDPGAALRFMNHWGPRNDGGLFRNRNHEGWDERADAIAAELEGMKPLIAAEGRADWAKHFIREKLD